jgi:triosephosphate isomerase
MPHPRLIAANWKMNGDPEMARAFVAALARRGAARAIAVIAPPTTLLPVVAAAVAEARWSGVAPALAGQDCHVADGGAHTGDVSAPLLAAAGATWVIVGHSERRQNHGETDAIVKAKGEAAARAGLRVMLCVGERAEARDAGAAEAVVASQVQASLPSGVTADRLTVAYEPVWAIGTGRVAGPVEIAEMHARLGRELAMRGLGAVPILYGGSVKPDNARMILGVAGVGGLLVGGASLTAEGFGAILDAA